jgi:hypothetical protein
MTFQLKMMQTIAVVGLSFGVVLILICPLILVVLLLAGIICIQRIQKRIFVARAGNYIQLSGSM